MDTQSYPLEDIRTFLTKRASFLRFTAGRRILRGNGLSDEDYRLLKERKLQMSDTQAFYWRAFIDGWTLAKA